eukprot:3318530-Rhodomonas_salina.3
MTLPHTETSFDSCLGNERTVAAEVHSTKQTAPFRHGEAAHSQPLEGSRVEDLPAKGFAPSTVTLPWLYHPCPLPFRTPPSPSLP